MAAAWPACTQGALAGGRGDDSRGRAQGARGPEAQPGVSSSPACGGRAEGCSLVEAGFVLAFHQVFCTELADPACRLDGLLYAGPVQRSSSGHTLAAHDCSERSLALWPAGGP